MLFSRPTRHEYIIALFIGYNADVLMKADGKTRASFSHGQQLNAHAESIDFLNATSITLVYI